ncbi:hypothetical protein, partial [Pseudomonas savastanoi]|uniref:hypothetical protein n=1 Tax=Pseudomonas savastanoi TaxID=29438 RepID=UPI001C807BAB
MYPFKLSVTRTTPIALNCQGKQYYKRIPWHASLHGAPDIRLQTIIHFHLQTQDGLIRISLLCLATNLFVCRGFSFVAKEKAAAL